MRRRSSAADDKSRANFNFVVLNQYLGRGAYILSLIVAALAIPLWLSSYSRLSLLKKRWLCGLLYFVSGGTLLFLVTDLYLTFYPPKIKFVLMFSLLVNSVDALGHVGVFAKEARDMGKGSARSNDFNVPLAVLSVLVPTITLFDDNGTLSGLLV